MATSSVQGPGMPAWLRDRRFYLFVTILTAAVVFVGFARTFFLNAWFARLHLPPLFIVHGVVFSTWLVVLVTQSLLVSVKQVRIHKRLGYASAVLVAMMFYLGWVMSVEAAKRGFTPPGGPPPITFLAFQLLGLLSFIAFIAAGYLFRNRPETHKRLMIAGTVLILTPAVARIFMLFGSNLIIIKAFAVQLALLIVCTAYDLLTRRRIHAPYIVAAVTLLALLPVAALLGPTRLWLEIARRISGV
jgi:hypothetical protein